LNVEYYAQRASAGLIIAEGTAITREAHGYPNAPGIYTQEQIAGWRGVTDAVHTRGGRIILQIGHNGRNSHSSLMPNGAMAFGRRRNTLPSSFSNFRKETTTVKITAPR
jgi:N-ethylmaleimide reductase